MYGYDFTNSVRQVLAAARNEAAELAHEYVGTEHILLAMLGLQGTVAYAVLTNLGIEPAAMRDQMLSIVERGRASRTGPDLPYTARAKKVIEIAMSRARGLGDDYVGTEHLLLGLIGEERGIAAQVLASHGVTLDRATEEMRRVLGTRDREPGVTHSAGAEHFVRRAPGGPSASDRVREVMRSASEIAKAHGGSATGPVHVAIALLDHGEGAANTVFVRLGLDVAGTREKLVALLAPPAPPQTSEEATKGDSNRMWGVASGRVADGTTQLSTAHLALTLLADGSPVAPIFAASGVTRASFEAELARISG